MEKEYIKKVIVKRQTESDVYNLCDKTNKIIFFKDKQKYLFKLNGKVLLVMFNIMDKLAVFNENKIIVTSDFRQYMNHKFSITPANLSNYLRGLTSTGILKKLGNNVYVYNPHIFYYADEKVAEEMRENFVCEFDEVNLKIKINSIKTYFNFK